MIWRALLLLLALATTGTAETIMSPGAFERYTTGTTLYFNRSGAPYGAEQYLDGRRVIWTFLDGECQRGSWYPADDQICFLYETEPDAQCWHFLETGTGRSARVVGDDPINDLTVEGQDEKALLCPGPEVGVSYRP